MVLERNESEVYDHGPERSGRVDGKVRVQFARTVVVSGATLPRQQLVTGSVQGPAGSDPCHSGKFNCGHL